MLVKRDNSCNEAVNLLNFGIVFLLLLTAEITEMLPTILSQLRAENFSSALKKLATSGGRFNLHSHSSFHCHFIQSTLACDVCLKEKR